MMAQHTVQQKMQAVLGSKQQKNKNLQTPPPLYMYTEVLEEYAASMFKVED
jgi:hypothetical protein